MHYIKCFMRALFSHIAEIESAYEVHGVMSGFKIFCKNKISFLSSKNLVLQRKPEE